MDYSEDKELENLRHQNRILKEMIVSVLNCYEECRHIEDFEDSAAFLRFIYKAKKIRLES